MGTQWVRSPEVVWEELGGEALLIDRAENSAWVLNPAATHIWKYCGCRGIQQLAGEFARVGNRRLSAVESDVRGFLDELHNRGLYTCAVEAGESNSKPSNTVFQGIYEAPALMPRSLGAGPRRRPSPRGNSGPG